MGRKRHIVVDTIGLLLAVVIHPADVQDRDGAKLVINKLIGRFPRLWLIWADAGYAGQLVDWVQALTGWILEIVRVLETATSSRCCPDDGSSNEPWRGWAGVAV